MSEPLGDRWEAFVIAQGDIKLPSVVSKVLLNRHSEGDIATGTEENMNALAAYVEDIIARRVEYQYAPDPHA